MTRYESEQARRNRLRSEREDKTKFIAGVAMLVVMVVTSVVYGVYWWTHCAGVPFLDAPMLCHAGSSQR